MQKLISFVSAAAVVIIMGSQPAYAMHCPADMKKIDAVLNSPDAVMKSGISKSDLAKAQGLRAKGEGLHKAKKHQESVDTLAEAMKMLGIK